VNSSERAEVAADDACDIWGRRTTEARPFVETASAAFNLAVVLEAEGDVEGARQAYQRAVDANDEDVSAYAAYHLGPLLEDQGDLPGARAAYRVAVETGHPHVGPRAARHLARLGQGHAGLDVRSWAGLNVPDLASPAIGVPRAIWKQVLLSILTLGYYGYYWAYRSHEDIARHSGSGFGGIQGIAAYALLLPLELFLLPLQIKRMYERDGQESPVSAATAFWYLLCCIPWYVKCQKALNQYWASKGAPPPRRDGSGFAGR
jgi:tetratricopeptide (TPR) repeat protein